MANDKIFISAGDLSGDMHAANLVKEIKKLSPSTVITASGGENLKAVSDSFIEDIVNINAFGFFPLKPVFVLKETYKKIKAFFLSGRPDKVILVDYYGFHSFVAKLAKRMEIPVYYYVSPQVWASRRSRIKVLAANVKKMLCILPFEEKLYRDQGVDAFFVGNPLIDLVPEKTDFGPSSPPLIGLFPGSRKSVIKRHMPIILKTAAILREKLGAGFIIFSVNKNISAQLPDYIKHETGGDFEKRKLIDIALCPSGTVSLENSLLGIPMAVMYKLSYFNYFFIKMIATVKYITLANILAGKSIVPEFIQFDAEPEKIASCIIEQLKPGNYALKVNELLAFRKMLGKPGVSRRTAEIILSDK